MSSALFARAQELLERVQQQSRDDNERMGGIERQNADLSQRVRVLEAHIALMRAKNQEALERAGRTDGNNSNAGN